jgi:hypothetical protein
MSNNYLQNIEKTRNTKEQLSFYEQLTNFIETSDEPLLSKFRAFSVYTPRQAITVFLERYEIFKLIKNTPGSIVECGVGSGQGLMAFAHFCSIFEPYHYTRKVIGFDTFEGFTGITDKDKTSKAAHMVEGGLNYSGYEKMVKAAELYDQNRTLGHIPKIDLVKGDISQTFPKYLEKNPALVIGLLYLDLDLYQPTIDTIKLAIKRLPKGAVICFDELNHKDYPGETLAVIESLGLENIRLRRLDMASMMSYAIIGE